MAPRRALITGYGGFVGGHLAEHLLGQGGWDLAGTVIDASRRPAGTMTTLRSHAVDLRHPDQTRILVSAVRPEVVFHLAGQAFVPAAWQDPWATIETNVRMQLNVLEAALALVRTEGAAPVRVLAVTSNEVYGLVPDEDLPVDEAQPLAPANPYATSKAAQDLLALQYHQFVGEGLEVVRLRPFNHIGPRQDPRFVVASFAQQVAEIEAGKRPPRLLVGDLSAERDFTDVRDMVRAYRLVAEHARPGEVYNLGSGRCYPIQMIVRQLAIVCAHAFRGGV